jgi:hypothetical protein
MNRNYTFKKFGFILLLLLFVLSLAATDGFSAVVSEDEAIAVADMWYAMELNSSYTKIDEKERTERLDNLQNREVLYLVSKDDLLDSRPDNDDVLAYVIKYNPSAFVIVSGEDRIIPIIGFGVESEFCWDHPELNTLRYLLGKAVINWWSKLSVTVDVHPNWSYLRSKLHKNIGLQEVTFEAPEETIYVLWDTALWGQMWPYNTTVVANNGNTTGIPTGCVATAMAIKMRFHEWPATGYSSHSYTDNEGDIRFSHSVNFGAHNYNWANMPTTSLTAVNNDVADLMYHCGVAVNMDYEVGSSSAWDFGDPIVKNSMNMYFRYKGTGHVIDQNSTAHNQPAKTSIRGGLTVVCGSMGHAMVIDGYRSSPFPYFHMNYGWNGKNNGWFDLLSAIVESLPYSSPQNYIYVDSGWTGAEDGNIQNPYNTLSEGNFSIPTNGHLWIKEGTYTGADNVPITFSKAMTIKSYEGTVTIGQ